MRIDLRWRDFLAAALFCIRSGDRTRVVSEAQQAWAFDDQSLITLSVRSGFDLILRSLRLPAGSEIMFTAMTVPDMVRIAEEHGLVAVPVDVDPMGDVDMESLRAAISEKTRMFVAAHLFGGQLSMGLVAENLAPEVLIVEDCAQHFHSVGAAGHLESDFVLHSFGPIKTATALGGAVVRVASAVHRGRMREISRQDPVQSRPSYAKRVIKFAVLKFLSGKRRSSVFCWCVKRLGRDVDAVLTSLGRGFEANNLLDQLRRQPCTPLVRMLCRRWTRYDFERISTRSRLGRRLDYQTGQTRPTSHHYWVYPLQSDDRRELCRQLHMLGFDATCSSRMTIVEPSDDRSHPTRAMRFWNEVVFLPWYPELTDEAVDTMASVVREYQPQQAPRPDAAQTHKEGLLTR